MRLVAASVVLALTAIDCSGASERALLDQFFAASRLRDRTALARFSTVVFEPRSDGIVEEFVVTAVTPERQLAGDGAADDAIGLEGERQRVVSLSLADPIDPVDPSRSKISLWEKKATVSARVGSPDGTTAARSIVVTLQRARTADDRARSGRWIVVRFVGQL
jgi:hypothetical protein